MSADKLNAYIERAFWGLLLGIISLGVGFLKDMNASVSELNSKVAVMLERQTTQDLRIVDHEGRIIRLERRAR